jgi:hypothetical protein
MRRHVADYAGVPHGSVGGGEFGAVSISLREGANGQANILRVENRLKPNDAADLVASGGTASAFVGEVPRGD